MLLQAASLLSSKVRDEGLIIFDLKNASHDISLSKRTDRNQRRHFLGIHGEG